MTSASSTDRSPEWSVEDMGAGTYCFRWQPGFYCSPFCVTDDGVVVVDPIDDRAALGYRQAIATVTDAPVVAVLYSHDHRDHILGARVLAPDATVYAHARAAARIQRRGDEDLRPPDRLLGDADDLVFGRTTVRCRYYGPNHSDSNVAIILPTGAGPMLSLVDVLEPGVAPYRNLPDTDLRGLMDTLSAAGGEQAALVLGGHTGPAPAGFISELGAYFDELLRYTREEWQASGGQQPRPGEDGVTMTERVRRETCVRVREHLRPRYSSWLGFEEWVPMNADRVLSYLITGN